MAEPGTTRTPPAGGVFSTQPLTGADVQRAVSDAGVQLTWVRADTFLPEIARSRNVRKLLAPCLRRGFTIRKTTDALVLSCDAQGGIRSN